MVKIKSPEISFEELSKLKTVGDVKKLTESMKIPKEDMVEAKLIRRMKGGYSK